MVCIMKKVRGERQKSAYRGQPARKGAAYGTKLAFLESLILLGFHA